jgi:ATP-binding cassette subfamily B protein
MENLAYESKKSLSLAKVQSLFGPLMIALRISNLVVIYFGGIDGHNKKHWYYR